MKRSFIFPVWVFANKDEGTNSPCYVVLLGSSHPPHTSFPATLPVFSTEKLAIESQYTLPFGPIEVDRPAFCDMLKNNRSIENVVLDPGVVTATHYRVEELLAKLELY